MRTAIRTGTQAAEPLTILGIHPLFDDVHTPRYPSPPCGRGNDSSQANIPREPNFLNLRFQVWLGARSHTPTPPVQAQVPGKNQRQRLPWTRVIWQLKPAVVLTGYPWPISQSMGSPLHNLPTMGT